MKVDPCHCNWPEAGQQHTTGAQKRRQMSLGTYLQYEKSILGYGLGWTVKKKVWADYEQFLRPVFLSFHV